MADLSNTRADFERWFSDGGQYPKAVERNGDTYKLSTAHSAWVAWQAARSAISTNVVPAQAGAAEVDCSALLEAAMKDAYDHIGKCMQNGYMPEKAETDKRIVKYIVDRASAQPQAQGEHSAGVGVRMLGEAEIRDCFMLSGVSLPAGGEGERMMQAVRVAIHSAATAQGDGEHSGRDALLDDDLAALKRFHECATDFDSGGHDVPKAMMARLCEIGVMQSLGFGRHQTTSFGDYVLERAEGEPGKLPLMTLAERNAAAAIAAQQPAEGGEQSHG